MQGAEPTVSSSVAAGDPIQEKPITPNALLSMSASREGAELLALRAGASMRVSAVSKEVSRQASVCPGQRPGAWAEESK